MFFSGSHYLGKRSADSEAAPAAEADAKADPWLIYGGYGAWNYPYYGGYGGYWPYGYGYHSLGKRSADAEPEAAAAPVADAKADPWLVYGGAWNYPYYASYWPYYNYGYHYLGKRSADSEAAPVAEADAKADPWLLYGGYGAWNYPYYSNGGYWPYNYGYYYGK